MKGSVAFCNTLVFIIIQSAKAFVNVLNIVLTSLKIESIIVLITLAIDKSFTDFLEDYIKNDGDLKTSSYDPPTAEEFVQRG